MNDPNFDLFLAMVDGQPAGRCALYQVGDIARVTDLAVGSLPAGSDVERALLPSGVKTVDPWSVGSAFEPQ